MSVFITGATGFIGSRLSRHHLKTGDSVRYLTRTNNRPVDGAEPIFGDLDLIGDDFIPFFCEVDAFYNCAGEIEYKNLMYATHVQGTINLLNIIEKSRLKQQRVFHWVQLSSCGAYGQVDTAPRTESYIDESCLDNPSGEYESTKTTADNLIIAFSKKHSWFKYTIIRPTIVFGTGMRSTLLIRIASMIKKKLFFYIGNKNAVANFVHVDDVVQAMVMSLKQVNAYNQIFIVSNDCKLSDVVNAISEVLQAPKPRWVVNEFLLRKLVEVVNMFIKLPVNSMQISVMVRQSHYSNEKLIKAIGWLPADSILEQLKLYIDGVFCVNKS